MIQRGAVLAVSAGGDQVVNFGPFQRNDVLEGILVNATLTSNDVTFRMAMADRPVRTAAEFNGLSDFIMPGVVIQSSAASLDQMEYPIGLRVSERWWLAVLFDASVGTVAGSCFVNFRPGTRQVA